jgi:type I restriction enzyme S subunit
MKNGWRKTIFKNFLTLQRGFDLPRSEMVEGHYPVLGSTSVIGYHNEFKVNPPGVVTGRSGSLGVIQYVDKPYWPHNTALWVKDFKGNDPRFVYFFLQTLDLKNYNAGVGVPTLNRNHLDNLQLSVPSIDCQFRIASILSAYDDLIENNTQRIKILEEMVRLIYREWFIEWRIPNYELRMRKATPEEKKVTGKDVFPEGWVIGTIDGMVIRYKAGEKYTENNVREIGAVPVVDQSRDEYLGFHNNEPDHKATSDNPIIIFGDHTCKMKLMVEPFSVGPNVIPFTSIAQIPCAFLFFLIRDTVHTQEYKRHWNDLISKKVVKPDQNCMNSFAAFAGQVFSQMEYFSRINRNLRQTRDLLLPKLISGEVEV